MVEELNSILQYLLEPELPEWLLAIKIIFLFTSLFSLVFIGFAVLTTTWFKRLVLWDLSEIMTYRHYGLVGIEKKWAKIKQRLSLGTEPEAKLSIIEADELLNDTLKEMGYTGVALSDKLARMSTDILTNIEDIEKAHQLRSNIVHDPSYRLEIKDAEESLTVYEKALIELQAL